MESGLAIMLLIAGLKIFKADTDIHGLAVTDSAMFYTGKRGAICSMALPEGPSKCTFWGDELITSIAFSGYFGVAVGENGVTFISRNGGTTWFRSQTHVPYHLLDVEVLSDRVAIAVGDWGTVVRTEDGGKTWTDRPLESRFSEEFVGSPLLARNVVHPSTGKTISKGTTLEPGTLDELVTAGTEMFIRNDTILNDILVIGGDRIYVVGERGKVFLSRNQGLDFIELPQPPSPKSAPEGDEDEAETLFFAAGDTHMLWVGGSLGSIFKLELHPEGGIAKRTRIPLPGTPDNTVFAGAALDTTLCLAGGDGFLATSFDGGTTFNVMDLKEYRSRWFRRAWVLAERGCLFAGEEGRILLVEP